jgi:hypothetical protein
MGAELMRRQPKRRQLCAKRRLALPSCGRQIPIRVPQESRAFETPALPVHRITRDGTQLAAREYAPLSVSRDASRGRQGYPRRARESVLARMR